jgi:hypothetical protein
MDQTRYQPSMPISFIQTITKAMSVSSLLARDNSVCDGKSDFNMCGEDFPSSWCCLKNSTCLRIYGTNSTTAICCPNGNNCNSLHPTNWTATDDPLGAIHVEGDPPSLQRCGYGYCPPSYDCLNGACLIRVDARQPLSNLTPTSTAKGSERQSFGLGVGVGILLICAAGLLIWLVWLFCFHKNIQAYSLQKEQISYPVGANDRQDFLSQYAEKSLQRNVMTEQTDASSTLLV